jgi:hypothetical protein
MALDDTYIKALSDFLNDQNEIDPPIEGGIALIRPGLLQESPVKGGEAVITLHLGDPDDDTYRSEQITEQARRGEEQSGHALQGGYMEIGGGGLWWHRYSAVVRYFMIRRGETRAEAQTKADSVMQWTRRLIAQATPRILSLVEIDGESPVQVGVTDYKPIEGGGEKNWIWQSTIHMRMLAYHEN